MKAHTLASIRSDAITNADGAEVISALIWNFSPRSVIGKLMLELEEALEYEAQEDAIALDEAPAKRYSEIEIDAQCRFENDIHTYGIPA